MKSATMRAASPSTAARPPSVRWLRKGLTVVVFCSVVGTLLYLLRGSSWGVSMVYAQATGLSTWGLMELGTALLRQEGDGYWPRGWRLLVVLGGAVVIGYVVGTVVGDLVRGGSTTWDDWRESPRVFISYIAMSLSASVVAIYYFHSRTESSRQAADLAAAERQAAEAKLAMLQSQIEPHMLFNTLANLRVLIGIDPARAQAMLDQLIGFLRATLDASRGGSHSLASEFARIADYLALMQVRMGARLQTRLDLPQELAALAVPPLLLQPLVENAIKHGLEPKVEGGRIDIGARRVGDSLVLSVRDTGVGLAGQPADGARFGLHQVRERLATLHGHDATLDLAAAQDGEGGAIATLSFPMPR